MDSTDSLNSKVIAIEGNFDDAQTAVKKIFNDQAIKAELKEKNTYLSSSNSINIGRLLPQVVYYFYAYADLVNKNEINCRNQVSFCVPTGNFGDILAGFYAKEMGLPVGKLIIASNDNNVLTDFFTSETYDANRELVKTISPSMDILVSSNLERLIFHKSSDQVVREKMEDLRKKGSFSFDGDFSEFLAGFANKKETEEAIKKVYENEGYLIDPHTSVAKAVVDKLGLGKTVILSTASPYKFAASLLKVLGENPKKDAIFNISRAAMLVLALKSGSEDNLKTAIQDKIHQPYRMGLIPEKGKFEEIIRKSHALGSYLSRAGSTIMLVLNAYDQISEKEIREKLGKLSNSYDLKALEIDKKGAFII